MFCPANVESGENMGDRVEGLPEQFVGNTGHWHSAALALAIKRADYVVGEIPADMMEDAKHYREQLIEKVSEADDKILEKYLKGEEPTEAEIKAIIDARTFSAMRFFGSLRSSSPKATFWRTVICGQTA